MDTIPSKFERFTDPTGERMSNKDLKMASWVARHRVLVHRLLVGILSIVAGALCAYGIFGLLHYAVFGFSDDKRAAEELVQSTANYTALQSRYAANELRILDANVYEAAVNRYDFVATVVNDNLRWAAIVSYKFTYAQGETEVVDAVILPQTERPVLAAGHKSDVPPSGVTFEIIDIQWKSIDTHAIADVAAYTAERRNFSFTDMVFTGQDISNNIPSNILQFTLHNNSAYSFWDVPVIVELYENGSRVGIAQTKVEKLKAGEKRPLDLRTLTPNISVTDIKVHPTVNIFDSRVFMTPEAN